MESLEQTMRTACKKIAPLWPLESFVAVNPYLGLTDRKFENVAQELATAGGIQMTLPLDFYLKKIEDGKITNADVFEVLRKRNRKESATEFIDNLKNNPEKAEATSTFANVADIATQVTGKDWNRFVTGRISVWAASYFDKGQASWCVASREQDVFTAWKTEASIDRTPELTGLKNFRKLIKAIPDNPIEATAKALNKLGISEKGIPLYLHKLLLKMGGWSAFTARLDWDTELYGGKDGKLISFLAVLSCWEACLLESLNNKELYEKWEKACEILSLYNIEHQLNRQIDQKLILQEAFDLSAQRNIIEKFEKQQITNKPSAEQPKAQAVFCIDVRSEVFRRNLEMVDPEIQTMGFAGFFAFPVKYVPIGHQNGDAQCPVLLPTGPTIAEQLTDKEEHKRALNARILKRDLKQLMKSFKAGAVTCFSYVSPLGLSYLPKLFTDSFGLTRPVPHPDSFGFSRKTNASKTISLETENVTDENYGISLADQIAMAKNALKTMSLSDNFAKYILIAGHGSSMVNNPHASGYDCGACGGRSGEPNAKVAAAVLNNKAVRAGLQKEDIYIPVNTIFLACLHDTTTDEITIFNENEVPEERKDELLNLKKSLAMAGKSSRLERALRFSDNTSKDIDKAVTARSKDWSQVRPEWGLAGCAAFVVAPRERTKDINFEGKSFLHSYDWKKDEGFKVLELIMTAPMVVTSWINLQYYGSSVDNTNHGSGNKTLHNVTAGVGVLEGYSGDLRVGLPLQAIHDGENFQHEPLRLNVIIEAPIEAMNTIIEKHPMVRDLCDNGWLSLLALDENGKVSYKYSGNLNWERLSRKAA